jgi:cation diffusion facilitator family transporter
LNPVEFSLALNAVSTILFAIGLFNSSSISVQIGVLNDLTDTIGLLIMLLSLRSVRRSFKYPFGTERGVYITSLIALMMFSGSIVGFAVNKISTSIASQPEVHSTPISLYSVSASTALNSVSLLYSLRSLRRNSGDPTTKGTIVDSTADTLAGLISLIALYTRSPIVDIVGSLLMTGLILGISLSIGMRIYEVLVGRTPPKKVLKEILDRVLKVDGVRDVNVFKAAMITEDEYLLILEVEVDGGISVEKAEKLADTIERVIKDAEPRFKHVYIELVPVRREPPTYKRIMSEIDALEE